MSVRMILGDVRDVIRSMPDNSVDLVMSSPPFLGLRSYLDPEHPEKGFEIGGEPTPADYLDTMLNLTEEFGRVVTKKGSIAIEIGDSRCVDEATEILTQRGWLRFDELAAGDIALTLNPESRLAEWQVVDDVHIHEPADRLMLSMEGDRGHSSLTTSNHRWLTESRTTTMGVGSSRPAEQNGFAQLTQSQVDEIRSRCEHGERQVDLAERFGVQQPTISKIVTGRTWTKQPIRSDRTRSWLTREQTSQTLRDEDRIPVSAPVANLPQDAKWSDALVEAVAWYWTEGNDRSQYGKARGLWIHQSEKVNGPHCERIRACLTRLFGPPVERLYGRSRWDTTDPVPQWREEQRADQSEMLIWKLNGTAADVIRAHAPNKAVRTEWLCELTQAQLDLFVDISVRADGHARRNEISLAQSNVSDYSVRARKRAEPFQTAAILAGRYSTLRPEMVDRWGSVHPRWTVRVGTKRYFKPSRTRRAWVVHSGIVWCPQLANGSWLARRKGAPFFTGNSGSGGAGGDYNEGGLREGQKRFDGSAVKARRLGKGEARTRAHEIQQTRKAAARERGKTDGGSWGNRNVDEALGIRPPTTHWKGQRAGWPPDKSLCGIPSLYAWSLAYGRNLLRESFTAVELLTWIDHMRAQGVSTDAALAAAGGFVAEHGPVHQFDPWRIRNLIVWARPNPPPGATGDRVRDACSYITWACRARDRWFDLDAVRHDNPRTNEYSRGRHQLNRGSAGYHTSENTEDAAQNPLGAPPLDFWEEDELELDWDEETVDYWYIAPNQYRGAHHAVMPPAVCYIPIETSCPRRVCLTCGEPSTRISYAMPSPFTGLPGVAERRSNGHKKAPLGLGSVGIHHGSETREATTIGWTSCECPGTGELWDPAWHDAMREIKAAEKSARKRGTTRDERKHIVDEVIPPLYANLAKLYQGRIDGMHAGDGWRPGVVLDPFGGTGTTAIVATQLGRDCILIDLDEDNVPLVQERVGIFLDSIERASGVASIT